MRDTSIPQNRPTAVVVLGVLHLVGGGLGLLGTVCGGLGQGLQGAFPTPGGAGGQENPGVLLQRKLAELPGQPGFTYGELAANLVLDVALVAAGIGLLQMRPWARTLSLIYAPLSIVNRLVGVVYSLVVVIPALDGIIRQMLDEMNRHRPAQAPNFPIDTFANTMKMVMIGSTVLSALVIAYPIVVLILLNRPAIKAAFFGEGPAAGELPEDEGWGAMRPRETSPDITARRPFADPDRKGPSPPEG
jgi:hypothetical protein